MGLFKGKIKNAFQDAIASTKAEVKKAVDNVKKTGGNIVGAGILAPLLPFKRGMSDMLRKKGVVPNSDFKELIKQFYTYILPKNFDGKVTQEHADAAQVDWSSPASIATFAIPLILTFFANLKKKKESGQPLSVAENTALVQISKDLGDLQTTKDEFLIFGINGWYVIGGAAILGVGVSIYLKNKKKFKKD